MKENRVTIFLRPDWQPPVPDTGSSCPLVYEFFQELPHIGMTPYAAEPVPFPTVFEEHDSRQTSYVELGRQIPVSLNVYLDEAYAILEVSCEFLHDRCERMAWSTPVRPEVDHDWRAGT